MPAGPYTDAEIDAAVASLTDPERLREAQDLVTRAAPQLQRVLATALESGGWFGTAHEELVQAATEPEDPGERARAVSTLVAAETRVGMLVRVAVWNELAHELQRPPRPRSRNAFSLSRLGSPLPNLSLKSSGFPAPASARNTPTI